MKNSRSVQRNLLFLRSIEPTESIYYNPNTYVLFYVSMPLVKDACPKSQQILWHQANYSVPARAGFACCYVNAIDPVSDRCCSVHLPCCSHHEGSHHRSSHSSYCSSCPCSVCLPCCSCTPHHAIGRHSIVHWQFNCSTCCSFYFFCCSAPCFWWHISTSGKFKVQERGL